MQTLLFLLLPIAALSGWIIGRRRVNNLPAPKFFAGLDFEISKQPDHAIDLLVQMPDLDKDAVDTHLTLGSIFRKRGEIDRAIRLHQGLLERSNISEEQQSLAQLELARDYIAAGVLDRSESLLLELIGRKKQIASSLRLMLDLYQQEKEWLSAINIAEQLQDLSDQDLRGEISHFYCELVEQSLKTNNTKQARYFVKCALKAKNTCVRGLILRANIEQVTGSYSKAIEIYRDIGSQDVDVFALIINDLIKCYQMVDVNSKGFDLVRTSQNPTKYKCDHCGFTLGKLQWHCPSCRKWDVIKPLGVS